MNRNFFLLLADKYVAIYKIRIDFNLNIAHNIIHIGTQIVNWPHTDTSDDNRLSVSC